MNAATRMDETMRELVRERYREFEAGLGKTLLGEFVVELAGRWQKADRLLAPLSEADAQRLAGRLQEEFASILAAGAAQEDVNRLIQRIAEALAAEGRVTFDPDLLTAQHALCARRGWPLPA